MSLNKVMVIGHLGQDPEIRYTPAGMPVVNLSVATDEPYVDKEGKRQERVEWHKVVVIGKLGLSCHQYLKKGRQVFVEGRLHTRVRAADSRGNNAGSSHWESNGASGRRTEIAAVRVEFLGSRSGGGEIQETEAQEITTEFSDSSELNE
jgi:single-strand DNA-binding protein